MLSGVLNVSDVHIARDSNSAYPETSTGLLGEAIDERVPHGGGDGAGLGFAQSEHAFDYRQLRAGGVQAAERTPVVHHHPRRDDLAPPIYRSRH